MLFCEVKKSMKDVISLNKKSLRFFALSKGLCTNIMATNNEITTDVVWEEMKSLAVEQQQCFYECLPDCTEYKFDEHKYLKQNIGYAIFGLPMINKDANTTKNDSCYWKSDDSNDTDADITDTIDYDGKAKSVIDIIYNKICECTIETDNTQPIYFGIIYNIIFRSKMNVKPKKKEVKEEAGKETKVYELVKQEEEKEFALIPIFKIRRNIQKETNTAKRAKQKENTTTKEEADYEIWYIDTCGRVYKSWENYVEKNNLPKCTMVLPKGGFYQADLLYPVTEDYSTVWLEITESPACQLKTKILNGIDIVSNVAGFGTAGLGVAALFTPLAPVAVITGLVATGVTSIWTVGRSSQQLIDRKNHEQSIHLMDKEALPHWLGIAGTTFGLGALGGSAALSKAAANGKTIPTVAKAAFNTVQGGNILLNGVGIVYQGFNLIDKYRTEKTVSHKDALYLAMHVMFFAGSVVKIQFANDIIESTQGKVINDYKDTLRKRNLRKKFNRVARKAAENNTCKISENTEVIQYIKHREQLLSANQSVSRGQTLDKNSRNIIWSLEHGKLKVNDIVLLEPTEFVLRLMKSGIFNENYENNSSVSRNNDDFIADRLVRLFQELLTKFYLSDACPRSKNLPMIPDFEPLIKDMNSMKIDENCLKKLFIIVEKLMKRSKSKEDFLLLAFGFVWQYCKANLKQWGINSCHRMRSNSGSNILQKIIIAVFEAVDMMINNLSYAFAQYVKANSYN